MNKNGIKNISDEFTWNGCWYGQVRSTKPKYYRSHNVRFDDTCGGTEEITEDEYHEVAVKYAKVFRD